MTMMVVDGVRKIDRIYKVSKQRQEEIAENWRIVAQVRRQEGAARPRTAQAERPLTPEERERFRELAVILTKAGLLDSDMPDAEAAEVTRRLEAWIRDSRHHALVQVRRGAEDRALRTATSAGAAWIVAQAPPDASTRHRWLVGSPGGRRQPSRASSRLAVAGNAPSS